MPFVVAWGVLKIQFSCWELSRFYVDGDVWMVLATSSTGTIIDLCVFVILHFLFKYPRGTSGNGLLGESRGGCGYGGCVALFVDFLDVVRHRIEEGCAVLPGAQMGLGGIRVV